MTIHLLKSDAQFVDLGRVVCDYAHDGEGVVVEYVCDIWMVFHEVGMTEAGQFKCWILLKDELFVENEAAIEEIEEGFQALLAVNTKLNKKGLSYAIIGGLMSFSFSWLNVRQSVCRLPFAWFLV